MKKITGLLTVALVFALLFGVMVGVTAAADTKAADDEWVASANVAYSESIYPYFAIDASLAKDASLLSVTAKCGDGEAYTCKLMSKSKDIYGDGSLIAHIVKGDGIAAKNMATTITITVSYDGNVVETTTYSIARYFFERLYKNGIVNATAGEDLLRKDLYVSALEYGAAANVVLNQSTSANLAYVWGDVDAQVVTVGSSIDVPAGDGVVYTVQPYDLNGKAGEAIQITEATSYTVNSSVKISVNKLVGSSIKFNEENWEDYVTIDGTLESKEVVDEKLVLTDSSSGGAAYLYVTPISNSENVNAAVFELDFAMTRTSGSRAFSITFHTADSKRAYMLECRFDATTELFYIGDKSESKDQVAFKSGYFAPAEQITLGDTVNIRVEYYSAIDGQGNTSMRALTYLNDQLVLYSNNWYGVTSDGTVADVIPASDIAKVNISTYTSHVGTTTYDNVSFALTDDATPTDAVELKYSTFSSGAMNDSAGNVYLGSTIETDERAAILAAN